MTPVHKKKAVGSLHPLTHFILRAMHMYGRIGLDWSLAHSDDCYTTAGIIYVASARTFINDSWSLIRPFEVLIWFVYLWRSFLQLLLLRCCTFLGLEEPSACPLLVKERFPLHITTTEGIRRLTLLLFKDKWGVRGLAVYLYMKAVCIQSKTWCRLSVSHFCQSLLNVYEVLQRGEITSWTRCCN